VPARRLPADAVVRRCTVQNLRRPCRLDEDLWLSQAGSEMLTNMSRTLDTLRTGACTGLSVLPFNAVYRIVNHTAYPAQTQGPRPDACVYLSYCCGVPGLRQSQPAEAHDFLMPAGSSCLTMTMPGRNLANPRCVAASMCAAQRMPPKQALQGQRFQETPDVLVLAGPQVWVPGTHSTWRSRSGNPSKPDSSP